MRRIKKVSLAGGVLLTLFSLSLLPAARVGFAQSGNGSANGIAHRVAALEAMVSQQQQQIGQLQTAIQQMQSGNTALAGRVTALEGKVAALEDLTQDMTRLTDTNTGQPTVRFSGVNLQVVDGSGDTEGAVNGLGNLIVGYNEFDAFSGLARNGSHNLIVGSFNDYASYGGIVAGRYNRLDGRYATITAGSFNYVSGFGSTVSGGDGNRATNTFSSVSGGFLNHASGDQSSVSGGVGVVQPGTFGWSAGSNGPVVSGSFRSP